MHYPHHPLKGYHMVSSSIPSIILRKPLDLVQNCLISDGFQRAFFKFNCTPSNSNILRYCFTSALTGSVNIRTKASRREHPKPRLPKPPHTFRNKTIFDQIFRPHLPEKFADLQVHLRPDLSTETYRQHRCASE